MLSDEELEGIGASIADDDMELTFTEVARRAFALGAERARVVKPLEWIECTKGSGWQSGRYEINKVRDTAPPVYQVGHDRRVGSIQMLAIDSCRTLEQAQAIAQAHHEAFVLSKLEPV